MRNPFCFTGIAAAAFCAMPLCAADIVIGAHEAHTLHVTDSATLSDRVIQAEYGHLYKTGTGTLTVRQQAVSNSNVRMEVLAGKVTLDNVTSAGASASSAPSAASRAALWLDASQPSSMLLADGTSAATPGPCAQAQGIARWYDRREETPGTTHVYPYGVSSNSLGTVLATIGLPQYYVTNGTSAVHFGKYGSGRYLDLYWCGGSQLSFTYSVAHVFFVYGFFDTWGYLLGRRAGDAHWYNPGHHTMANMSLINTPRITTVVAPFTAATYLNGVWVDQFTQRPDKGFGLIRQDFVEQRALMNSIFATKAQTNGSQTGSCAGVGGDFICEALIFTNVLSETECAAIDEYLIAKWNLPRTRAGANRQEYALAPNATLEVETAANGDTLPVAVSGTGTLVKKGAGMMSISSTDSGSFSGTVDFQAGSIVSRGGRLPPFKAAAGTEMTSAEYGNVAEGSARNVKNGVKLTKTSASGKAFVKSGGGELRVNEIDGGVSSVAVTAGTLTLEAPLASSPLVDTPDDISISLPNPGFEASASLFSTHCWPSSTESNGWWQVEGSTFYLTSDKFMNWIVPEGSQCVRAQNGVAGLFTTVSLPVAGTYEIAFRHTAREWENTTSTPGWGRQTVNVVVADATVYSKSQAGSFPVIASFLAQTAPWTRVRYRFTVDKAGSYHIGFRNRDYGIDNYVNYDDVTLRYVADAVRDDVWPIPAGDFEQIPASVKSLRLFSSVDKDGNGELATGWTFTSNAVATTVPVGLARFASFGNNDGHTNYMKPGDPAFRGQTQLCFRGNGGSVATTFTPPAGTWQLQARIGKSCHNDTAYKAAIPGIVASLKIGEDNYDLGAVSNKSFRLLNRRWPTPFTVNGSTPVTLTLAASSSGDLVISDDYVLVKSGTAGCSEGEELILNGNFEMNGAISPWTGYCEDYSSSSPVGKYNGCGILTTPNSIYAPTSCEGKYAFRIQQTGGLYQSVTIPEPGLYRLSYMQAPRPGLDYGFASTRAWIRKGSVTSPLGRAVCASDSWQRHEFTFRVAEAGNYTVGIVGIGRIGCPHIATYGDQHECDHTCCIDCVSLKRVDENFAATPTVTDGRKFKLSVATNSFVVLDFDGCLKVSGLKLGSQTLSSGTVTAADYPAYLSGRGSLEIEPVGTVLLFR